ncbi:MAG: serine hydrolase [Clostridium sp.]
MNKFKKSILTILILIFTISLVPSRVFAEGNTPVTPPDLYAKSAISMDLNTNEIIFSKNVDSEACPASITKLLTALLLAENKEKGDLLTYTENAKNQPPFSYGLNVHPVNIGDEITAEDAMDALLLYSGNDIAYMVVDNVAAYQQDFVKLLNSKAKSLNMTNSSFVTPNGLDDDTDNHYSSALDVAKLTKAAYENAWVRETMAKTESEINFINGNSTIVQNRNKLLGSNGCIGGKTGYTAKAGKCLSTIYERDGRTLIGVVMNSAGSTDEDTQYFEDMEKLMDYSYSLVENPVLTKDSVLKTVKIPYKVIPLAGPLKTIEIPVSIREDVNLFNSEVEYSQDIILNVLNPWTIKEDLPIGKLKITQKDYVKEYDLYSNLSKMQIIKENLTIFLGLFLGIIVILALIIIITAKIKNRKIKNRRYS